MSQRSYTLIDKFCLQFDQALRVVTGQTSPVTREDPAATVEDNVLDKKQQNLSAALMRVNHVGEVCAQALYQGQAFTAKSEQIKIAMQQAAAEENDHLAWCGQRLIELQSHPSYLNPVWYSGAFLIGAVAGLIGDRWSLGFVVETERQVEAHLANHLQKLPEKDSKSRAVLLQMKIDEAKHADLAVANGAAELPSWIKALMRLKAKIMTTTAYWI